MVTRSTFLFCDAVPRERIRWLKDCIETASSRPDEISSDAGVSKHRCAIFLTGDALFSLVDARTRDLWHALSMRETLQIFADGEELQLHGLRDLVASQNPGVVITGDSEKGKNGAFWNTLLSRKLEDGKRHGAAAFLLCNSPYMSRIPVYMLRFLECAVSSNISPELYSYLDGVHTLHDGQHPSEFENIGKGVSAIASEAEGKGRDPYFAACSRCATARGYFQMNPGTGFCEPSSCIDAITIRSLKDILKRFQLGHPIISHSSGGIFSCPDGAQNPDIPRLVMFISRPPYCSEWAFGGLSLALAAAMDGIEVSVVFIEDGIYALCGTHIVSPHDRVFNIQEMIAATIDVPTLQYMVFSPSLQERSVEMSGDYEMIEKAGSRRLAETLWGRPGENTSLATRVLFF